MAKIVLTVDTDSKECSCSVDGKEIPLSCMSLYKYNDGGFNLCIDEHQKKQDGITTTITHCAYAKVNDEKGLYSSTASNDSRQQKLERYLSKK